VGVPDHRQQLLEVGDHLLPVRQGAVHREDARLAVHHAQQLGDGQPRRVVEPAAQPSDRSSCMLVLNIYSILFERLPQGAVPPAEHVEELLVRECEVGGAQHPVEGEVVILVAEEGEEDGEVYDLLPLEEPQASVDAVRDPVTSQGVLELVEPRLRPQEDGDVAVSCRPWRVQVFPPIL